MPNAALVSEQLDRVLSFVPRAEGKAAFAFVSALGMLTFLVSNLPPLATISWPAFISLVPICTLGVSLWKCYCSIRPDLSGGTASLIYFGEIGSMCETHYTASLNSLSDAQFAEECSQQIWRNSRIVKAKFEAVDRAFWWLALSTIPWLVSLTVLSMVFPSASGLVRH